MTEIDYICNKVMEMGDTLAARLIKYLDRSADELSYNQACKRYGRSFVSRARQSGSVHVINVGNKLIFSRAELEAYKYANDHVAKSITSETV